MNLKDIVLRLDADEVREILAIDMYHDAEKALQNH